jgi:hypothetical protein
MWQTHLGKQHSLAVAFSRFSKATTNLPGCLTPDGIIKGKYNLN